MEGFLKSPFWLDDYGVVTTYMVNDMFIKTHGGGSRGQGEAACTRVFWPTRPLQ